LRFHQNTWRFCGLGFCDAGTKRAGVATAEVTFEQLPNPEPGNWLMNHHNHATMLFVFGL
jgi:hypothetical protein